jgi:hypothetical protein
MKPIIFSTLMVQAILDGRKTQTRRVINPSRKQINFMGDMDIRSLVRPDESTEEWLQLRSENGSPVTCIKVPYQLGDILWVRETWAEVSSGIIEYKATYKEPYTGSAEIDHIGNKIKWRPSIHMPREAARIFLRVKNVRVERLRDITEEDARDEGILLSYGASDKRVCRFQNYRDAFRALWDDLNKKRGYGWNMNPWVWVVEFERISKDEAYKKEG